MEKMQRNQFGASLKQAEFSVTEEHKCFLRFYPYLIYPYLIYPYLTS